MPTTNLKSELQPKIDAFLQEISELVRQAALESVQKALQGEGAAPARRGPGRPRKATTRKAAAKVRANKGASAPAKRRGRPGRRSPEEVQATAQNILDHVRANPGQRSEEIKAAIGLRPEDFQLPVSKLLADGKVRTEGQRRGTKYFAGGGGGRKAGKKTSKKAGRKAGKKRGTKAGKRKTTNRGAAAAATA